MPQHGWASLRIASELRQMARLNPEREPWMERRADWPAIHGRGLARTDGPTERLATAVSQACDSLEAAAASAREDREAHGLRLGASELLDWTEEIEAALLEVSHALRGMPSETR
jgi:hypothetical protein